MIAMGQSQIPGTVGTKEFEGKLNICTRADTSILLDCVKEVGVGVWEWRVCARIERRAGAIDGR